MQVGTCTSTSFAFSLLLTIYSCWQLWHTHHTHTQPGIESVLVLENRQDCYGRQGPERACRRRQSPLSLCKPVDEGWRMLAYAGVWKPTHVDECWRILAYGSLSMSTKTNSANSHLTPTPNVQMRVWGVRAFKDTRKLWSMCVCVHTVAYQHETCRACTDRSPDLSHDTDKRATDI